MLLLFSRPIIDLSVPSNALPSHYFLHHQPPAGQREILCELAASVARVEVIDQMPALYEFSAHFMVKRVKKKAFGATAGVVCGGGLYQQHPGQRVNIAAACIWWWPMDPEKVVSAVRFRSLSRCLPRRLCYAMLCGPRCV